MAEFTPITTQEEFDAAISSRLNRQKSTLEGQFAAERQSLNDKITEHEQTISSLQQSIADKESDFERQLQQLPVLESENAALKSASLKERIARETGLPYEFAARLSGDSEDALRADAQALAKFVTARGSDLPLAYTGDSGADKDPTKAALRKMVKNLNTGD